MIALGLGSGLKAKLEETIKSFPEIRRARHSVRIDVNVETMDYQYA